MKRWMKAVLAAAAGGQVVAAGALWLHGNPAAPAAIVSAAAIGGVLGLVLPAAARDRRGRDAEDIVRAAAAQPGRAALAAVRMAGGDSLASLSDGRPVLLVFVRHAGCCFCREAVSDLAAAQSRLEAAGISIALVHRSSDASLRRLLRRYKLAGIALIQDEGGRLYRAFGLKRGTRSQVLGPAVWMRGIQAAVLEGHGAAAPNGDPWQMPGIFLLYRRRILAVFYHRHASDRPDYVRFCVAGLRNWFQTG